MNKDARAALVAQVDGLPPVIARNVPKADFGAINPALQDKLAQAMAAQTQDEFALAQATPQELQARAAQQEAADKAAQQREAKAQKAEADKAQRDAVTQRSQAAADTFTLGGDAEQNLSGQQDIFAASSQETATTPKTEPQKPKTVIEKMKDARAKKEANTFIESPNGGLDYGEITPDMAKAMRRQAGKIRLQQGVQNADGTGWGLAHIEANHGEQIRGAGFETVQAFIQHIAGSFNEVLQATKGRQLLVAMSAGRKDVMFIQLEPAETGDFYRINTAFAASRDYLEKQEGKGAKVLWSGSEPRTTSTRQKSQYADNSDVQSGQSAPIAEAENYGASVAQTEQGGKLDSNGLAKDGQVIDPGQLPLSAIVETAKGEKFIVSSGRHGVLSGQPFTRGTRPEMSRDVAVHFATDPISKLRNPELRSEPLYFRGERYDGNWQTQATEQANKPKPKVSVLNGNKTVEISVVGQREWASGDNSRIYYDLEQSNKRSVVHSLYEVIAGKTKDDTISVDGRTFGYQLGIDTNSHTKRAEAEEGIEALVGQLVASKTNQEAKPSSGAASGAVEGKNRPANQEKQTPTNPFQRYDDEARTYGYTVRSDGAIWRGDKNLGVVLKGKGARLRIESQAGTPLFSGATSGSSFGAFVEKFWGATKLPQQATAQTDGQNMSSQPGRPAKWRSDSEQAGDVMFSRQIDASKTTSTTPIASTALVSVIERVASKWKGDGKASVVVAARWADLPAPIQEHAAQSNYDGSNAGERILGMVFNGKVYLVQENIHSVAEAEETLLHERVHQVLRGNQNDVGSVELRKALNQLYLRMGGGEGLVRIANESGVKLKDIRNQAVNTPSTKRNALAVEELLASIEGTRAYEKFPGRAKRAFQEFVGALRNWLRDNGFTTIANRLGANLDAATLSDIRAMLKGLRDKEAGAGDSAVRFLRVWHGTPHRGIEKTGFKLNKIGTGEGAQAYGHGIYFAQARDVADAYRGRLSTIEHEVDGKPLDLNDPMHRAAGIVKQDKDGVFPVEEYKNILQGNIDRANTVGDKATAQREQATLDALNSGKVPEVVTREGQLYSADIPENHELLDWDKPLREQPQKVLDALNTHLILNSIEHYTPEGNRAPVVIGKGISGDTTGQQLYSSGIFGKTPKETSDMLRFLGIPGLRYLDGNSRNNIDGTHNYVIWDESRLTPEAAKIEPMYSRSANTKAAYEARIDALFGGAKANREGIKVLDSSDMLGLLGYKGQPVTLAESKVLQGQDNHQRMTAQVWKKVPQWLENPAAVFDSDTVGGRLVFIAPEMVNGSPVRMIVEPNTQVGGLQVHLLVNAFDASGKTPWLRWAGDGLTRYMDKKKFPAILTPSGLQLSRVEQKAQGTGKILTEKNLAGWRKANAAQSADNAKRDSTAATLASAPSTLAKVQSAIEGMFEGIEDVRERIAQGTTVVQDASELPENLRQGAEDARAQALYDPYSDRVYMIASRIEQGQEKAVWLHEVFHKRGEDLLREALPRLHQAVQRWASRPTNSVERQIYEAAHARATNDGNYEAEFLAYAIEEAVNRGVQPDLKGNITSAGYWFGRVREAFSKVIAKLTGVNVSAKAINAEDLLAAAYGAAGLEVAGKQGAADATALRDLVRLAKASGNENKTLNLGVVSVEALNLLRSEGVAVEDGFTHSLDMFAVRHALNRHSDAKVEASRGQIAITESDVVQIADAIQKPTAYVLGGKTPRGQDVVGSIKQLTDGSLLYLEEVRSGRKTLAMTSMRKYPSTTDFDTIAKSVLPSNARSDTGDVRIVAAPDAQGKQFSRNTTTGHAQPLDEPVLTPSGWRSIGELQVGDEVYAHDGSITQITGVYPQGVQDVFRVELDDGRFTRATTDHLWQLAVDEGGAVTIATTKGLAIGDALPVV